MARLHYKATVLGLQSALGTVSPLPTASVAINQTGTVIPVAFSVWTDPVLSNAAANPMTPNGNGQLEFWLDSPQVFDLVASASGYNTVTQTVALDSENTRVLPDGSPDWTADVSFFPPLELSALGSIPDPHGEYTN